MYPLGSTGSSEIGKFFSEIFEDCSPAARQEQEKAVE
jgi:hypothetical protein